MGMELGGLSRNELYPNLTRKKDDTICYWILFCSFFSIVADKSKLWETMRIGAGLVCPKSILNHFVHVLTCWICTSFFSSFWGQVGNCQKHRLQHTCSQPLGRGTVSLKPQTLRPKEFSTVVGLRFEHGNPHPRCCGPESFQGPDWHNVSYSGAACPICSGRHRNVADECFAGAADSFFSAETTSCLYRLFML